jgi:hypothetical protein
MKHYLILIILALCGSVHAGDYRDQLDRIEEQQEKILRLQQQAETEATQRHTERVLAEWDARNERQWEEIRRQSEAQERVAQERSERLKADQARHEADLQRQREETRSQLSPETQRIYDGMNWQLIHEKAEAQWKQREAEKQKSRANEEPLSHLWCAGAWRDMRCHVHARTKSRGLPRGSDRYRYEQAGTDVAPV